MKNFLTFLLCGFMFIAAIIVAVFTVLSIHVCEYGTVSLKSIGIDYSLVCARVDNQRRVICEKNQ